MSTPTPNEAAELLRDYLDGGPTPDLNGKSELQTLDEALADERRATVERLRTRIQGRGRGLAYATRHFLDNILDEEAAR